MSDKAVDHRGIEDINSLFVQYFKPLVLFANNFIAEPDVDEDIVQDVFLSLLELRKEFDSHQKLKAYLYVAVKNRCLKYLRYKKVRQRHGAVYLKELQTDLLFQNFAIEEDILCRLVDEIEQMPAYYRNVFLLSLKGDSNQKIADQLGLTLETVNSYKKEGKALLRKRLKNLGLLKLRLILLLIA